MIRHIVMWKLKNEADGRSASENAVLVKEKLEALNGQIPGMLKLEVGIDFSRTQTSADIVLYSEFTDRESLDGYQMHPAHKAVMPFVQGVRDVRLMVDYETST